MTVQLTITGTERIVGLTERQQYALEQIEAADGGLSNDELGALMHERRSRHPADQRCSWCSTEGKNVAKELRGKKLVVHRRDSQRWESLRQPAKPRHSLQTDAIPF